MKRIIMSVLMVSSGTVFATEATTEGSKHTTDPAIIKEQLKADREQIENACTAESTTAGCGDKKVGKGLLKCIHAYKKSNKEFKISDGCKAALKKHRQDRKGN